MQGVNWSSAPDQSDAETARLNRVTPALEKVLELGKGPLTAVAAQRDYQETFADATEILTERSERKTLRDFASVDSTMRTVPSIDLRGYGQQALLSEVYGEGYTTFRSGTYEDGEMWVEESYHKNPMLAMAAGAVLTAEVNWGSPQLKAAALLTLGGVAAMQFAGDSPNYGGPIIDPIPPMPPSGPMVTPADTRNGPVVTSYPAENGTVPRLEGVPIAVPEYPGSVGGGYGAGSAPDLPSLLLASSSEDAPNGLRRDMKALRANMGLDAEQGYQDHHLIPVSSAQDSQALRYLAEQGLYDINRGSNGIRLPSNDFLALSDDLPVHRGYNGDVYNDAVRQELRVLDALYRAGGSDNDLLQQAQSGETKLRADLLNGKIWLNNADAALRELGPFKK